MNLTVTCYGGVLIGSSFSCGYSLREYTWGEWSEMRGGYGDKDREGGLGFGEFVKTK